MCQDVSQGLLLLDEILKNYPNLKKDLNEFLPNRFKYDTVRLPKYIHHLIITDLGSTWYESGGSIHLRSQSNTKII